MTVGDSELYGYDEAQKEMMNENCIIVDENDKITGQDSKINCHLGNGKLHRAFSVLIFNSNEKLLIQQRADEKITFPSIWANSCCSLLFIKITKRRVLKARRRLQPGN